MTIAAEFDPSALPVTVGDVRYTSDDFEADRRMCGRGDAGELIELVRVGDTATLVVSAAAYELPCA